MSQTAPQKLRSPGDYTKAVISLIDDARVSIEVFSPDLTPVVFGNAGLIAAVRGFAVRSRNGVMRILIRNATPLTRHDHRLLGLVQRISSKVSVRVLAPDFHGRDDAFVVADERQFALRRQAANWTGILERNRAEMARQLLTEYNEMWEHSLPDPGVRRLHI